MPPSLSLSLLLGLLLALATLGAPAYAATSSPSASPSGEGDFCADGVGISVVVDATAVGGDLERGCVAAEGEEAATDVLADAGVELTTVVSQPGFVCQVDGLPDELDCSQTPAGNSYWGLFLAAQGTGTGDGSGDGAWDYAPVGVDELRVSPGDFLGFSYQTTAQPTPPGAEPVAGQAAGTTSGATAGSQPNDGADIEGTPGTDAGVAADQGAGDGAPIWIFYVVVVVVAVGGLAFAMLRRRRRSQT